MNHSAALSRGQRDGWTRLAKLLSARACTAPRACYVREIRFLNTMNDCSGANWIAVAGDSSITLFSDRSIICDLHEAFTIQTSVTSTANKAAIRKTALLMAEVPTGWSDGRISQNSQPTYFWCSR
jgi:hypothetical protein